MAYYEDYRLKVIENENGRYDIYDSKCGGRITHKDVNKEQADERIQEILSIRNRRNQRQIRISRNKQNEGIQMRDITIAANAIENLLDSYADHKAMMKTYEEEVDFDIDKLANDMEYMYHKGFCEAAERWIRCMGISPDSPVVEKRIMDRMQIDKN